MRWVMRIFRDVARRLWGDPQETAVTFTPAPPRDWAPEPDEEKTDPLVDVSEEDFVGYAAEGDVEDPWGRED